MKKYKIKYANVSIILLFILLALIGYEVAKLEKTNETLIQKLNEITHERNELEEQVKELQGETMDLQSRVIELQDKLQDFEDH